MFILTTAVKVFENCLHAVLAQNASKRAVLCLQVQDKGIILKI